MKGTLLALLVGLFSLLSVDAVAADTTRKSTALDKVVVTGERIREDDVAEPTPQTEKLLKIPGSFGDPLQSVYSLPGVVQTAEAGGAPAVRGSGPDDNAFLIDFLPASFVFHDFGFSIFNENLIRDFGVKTAGFGSRYGRATGAIFDVTLREPRLQPWATTVDASFLRVGLMVEGKITDSQAAYVSVRESLLHLLLKARSSALEEEEDISFGQYPRARDFQAKYSWDIDAHNRLSVLGIGAQDQTGVTLGSKSDIALIDPGVEGDATLDTRFVSESVQWLFDDGVHRLQSAIGHLGESRDLSSGGGAEYRNTDADRWTIKSHYQQLLSTRHTLALGGEYQRADYDYSVRARYRSCSSFTPDCRVNRGPLTTSDNQTTIANIDAFIEDRWQISEAFAFTPGVHYTHNDYLNESYFEPRLAASLQVNPSWELHSSWGRYHQLPRIDQIIPLFGNPYLVSLAATHYVVGVTNNLDHGWSWTSDAYYKELDNVVVDINTPERYLNRATGSAYGAELMLNKNRDEQVATRLGDRWYGWLALSVSKTKRHNELNDITAVFDYDTPVVANLVVSYRLNKAWDAGIRWMLRSGLPYTPIIGNKPNPDFPGFYLPVYGDLNSARAAPFHRLDLRVERELRGSKIHGSFYIDIINLYARRNGGAAEYKPQPGSSEYTLEEQKSLPLLPSVGVKLTF